MSKKLKTEQVKLQSESEMTGEDSIATMKWRLR